MDWETYKELSHSPSYFTRWALDRTVPHVDNQLRECLEHYADQRPLEKPEDHKGGPETDVFELKLDVNSVIAITVALRSASTQAALAGSAKAKQLTTLGKSWEEYAQWLQEGSPVGQS